MIAVRQAGFGYLVPPLALLSLALVLASPFVAVLAAGGLLGVGLLSFGERLHKPFLVLLAAILIGYAFFSRGFAYVGLAPLYVGELTLALGVLCVLVSLHRLHLGVIEILLIAFMALGALRTAPYLGVHGIDALRDAVLWGYGLFALAVFVAMSQEGMLEKVPKVYALVLPVFLLASPAIGALATLTTDGLLPVPGSGVGLLSYKGGDAGVHLAGAAAFIALGLYSGREHFSASTGVLWLLWIAGFAVAGLSRAGMITAALGGAIAFLLRPSKRIVQLFLIAAAVVVLAAIMDIEIDLGRESGRSISTSQFLTGIQTIFGEGENEGGRLGTREFRLEWWGTIWDYTVKGPYFWSGKGFGINLADSDGFQVLEDESLRAPHNSHISVLARMGVPGLALWIALQGLFALKLFMTWRRANALGLRGWAAMDAWILVYWLAMMVNASFDPYLEGPQGGIWFWSIFGLGLYCIRRQEQLWRAADRPATSRLETPPLIPAAANRLPQPQH